MEKFLTLIDPFKRKNKKKNKNFFHSSLFYSFFIFYLRQDKFWGRKLLFFLGRKAEILICTICFNLNEIKERRFLFFFFIFVDMGKSTMDLKSPSYIFYVLLEILEKQKKALLSNSEKIFLFSFNRLRCFAEL